MKKVERLSVYDNLNVYCPLAKERSFIEITKWTNGEGFDVDIDGRFFSLTHGELNAIKKLVKALYK